MVKMINILGNEMLVAEDRVNEYLAQGHKLPEQLKTEPQKVETLETPAKPTTAKKTRKTRK